MGKEEQSNFISPSQTSPHSNFTVNIELLTMLHMWKKNQVFLYPGEDTIKYSNDRFSHFINGCLSSLFQAPCTAQWRRVEEVTQGHVICLNLPPLIPEICVLYHMN